MHLPPGRQLATSRRFANFTEWCVSNLCWRQAAFATPAQLVELQRPCSAACFAAETHWPGYAATVLHSPRPEPVGVCLDRNGHIEWLISVRALPNGPNIAVGCHGATLLFQRASLRTLFPRQHIMAYHQAKVCNRKVVICQVLHHANWQHMRAEKHLPKLSLSHLLSEAQAAMIAVDFAGPFLRFSSDSAVPSRHADLFPRD